MIPEEALDARANYVTQIKDVKWIEQGTKEFEENNNLLSKLFRPTSAMYMSEM